MTPLEALDQAMLATVVGDLHRRCPKPGGIIKRLPTKTRDALSKLTSDDLAKLRFEPDYIATSSYQDDLKRAFDRQMPS